MWKGQTAGIICPTELLLDPGSLDRPLNRCLTTPFTIPA